VKLSNLEIEKRPGFSITQFPNYSIISFLYAAYASGNGGRTSSSPAGPA
jgi:hypothetical protein